MHDMKPGHATDCRPPVPLIRALLIAWWLGLGWYFYHRPGLVFRWDLLTFSLLPNPFAMTPRALGNFVMLLLECAGFLALGAGAGELILSRFKLEQRDPLERLIFNIGLGWGALGLLMAALGLLKLWYAVPILIALSPFVVYGIFLLPRVFAGMQWRRSAWSRFDAALLLLLAAFVGLNLLGALTPEIFYDAMNCHLFLPDSYWRRHGFFPIPENAFSGVPMQIQMLFALALPVGGAVLTHFIHLAFGLLSALLVFEFGRRFADRRTGLLAALLFYSNPLVGMLSWKAAVDLGTTFYLFLSLYALALVFEDERVHGRRLALAGVLAGLTMGTKYQAWPLGVILTFVVVWRLRRAGGDWMKTARVAALFVVPMTAAMAVWPIRNWVLYGNPIYPFYQEWFAPGTAMVDWRAMLRDGGRDMKSLFGSWEGLGVLLRTPWELSTQQSDTRSFGPVFLLGMPLLAAIRFRTAAERLLLASTLALWAAWTLSSSVPRYFLPTFLPATLLFASAFERGFDGVAKKVGYALTLVVLGMNLVWTVGWFSIYDANDVIVGKKEAPDYLTEFHSSYPHPYYACARYVNSNLSPRSRLLVLGDERAYYIERDVVAPTAFTKHPLGLYLSESKSPEHLRDKLIRAGITHLFVNTAKLYSLGIEHWVPMDPSRSALLDAFSARYLRQLFQRKGQAKSGLISDWCVVYEIVPGKGGARP